MLALVGKYLANPTAGHKVCGLVTSMGDGRRGKQKSPATTSEPETAHEVTQVTNPHLWRSDPVGLGFTGADLQVPLEGTIRCLVLRNVLQYIPPYSIVQ